MAAADPEPAAGCRAWSATKRKRAGKPALFPKLRSSDDQALALRRPAKPSAPRPPSSSRPAAGSGIARRCPRCRSPRRIRTCSPANHQHLREGRRTRKTSSDRHVPAPIEEDSRMRRTPSGRRSIRRQIGRPTHVRQGLALAIGVRLEVERRLPMPAPPSAVMDGAFEFEDRRNIVNGIRRSPSHREGGGRRKAHRRAGAAPQVRRVLSYPSYPTSLLNTYTGTSLPRSGSAPCPVGGKPPVG